MSEEFNSDDAIRQMSGWYDVASSNISEFYTLITADPVLAITRIEEYISKARNSAGPGSSRWESFVGGPNHDWTGPVLDAIGLVYPDLEPEVKKKAFGSVLGFLDHLRYDYSQNHVELINEPSLVADIVINRPLYWCGYKEYTDMLEKYSTWETLYPHLSEVKSKFWLTLAVTRPKYASQDIRDNFFRIFPSLADKTQNAIAAITAVYSLNNFIREGRPYEEIVREELGKYDTRLVEGIRKKMLEKNWVDLDEPVYLGDHLYKRRSEVKFS